MADNSPTTALEELQSRFPHIYNVYDKKTVLYALLSIYAKNHEYKLGLIDRLYSALGIEDTYDEDLEWRWGSLLNLYRHPNESYDDYRSRLEIVYPSLVGGTTEAIKYATATAIGLTSDSEMIDQYIHVYDAWEYDGEIVDSSLEHDYYEPILNSPDYTLNNNLITNMKYNLKRYGAFVVTVDLSISEGIANYQKAVQDAVYNTKASGTQPYIIYLYIFYDSASINRNADEDTININDLKTEQAILAISDESLPEILTFDSDDIAYLLSSDDNNDVINQMLSELNDLHGDDITNDLLSQTLDDTGNITRYNNFFIPMLNGDNKLNDSIILSLIDSVIDVDEFIDIINKIDNDSSSISGNDQISNAIRLLQSDSGLLQYIDELSQQLSQVLDEDKSVDGSDNFTDNVITTIQQTGAINSAIITSMWSSNCINGSVTLNESLITNLHEDADVCIDIIHYN